MIALDRLKRQYFALVPPRLIDLPAPETLITEDTQSYLLEELISPQTLRQPEDGYRRLFWRKVIDGLEDGLSRIRNDDLEIDERFYELISTLMVQPRSDLQEPKPTYRTFIYYLPPSSSSSSSSSSMPTSHESSNRKGKQKELERTICLLEEQTVLQGGTTGLRTWTAALQLGHHLIHDKNSILTSHDCPEDTGHILEIGAGTGFLSVLLSQLGYRVISTDLDDNEEGREAPLSRLKHNVEINHSQRAIQVEALDWNDVYLEPHQRPEIWKHLERDKTHRVVLAADVIYDPDLLRPLVGTIKALLSSNSSSFAVVAATERNTATIKEFSDICGERDLDVELLELPEIDKVNPTFWDSGLDASVPVRIMRISTSSHAASS